MSLNLDELAKLELVKFELRESHSWKCRLMQCLLMSIGYILTILAYKKLRAHGIEDVFRYLVGFTILGAFALSASILTARKRKKNLEFYYFANEKSKAG